MKIFSHTLTWSDVNCRLAVTSEALPHMPRFEGDLRAQQLIVEDEDGKKWDFRFRIRKGRYKKPELSGDWLKFIKSKKLGIGDKIHFFKEEDEATRVTRYMIKVMTEVKLFGAPIGYIPYADQTDR